MSLRHACCVIRADSHGARQQPRGNAQRGRVLYASAAQPRCSSGAGPAVNEPGGQEGRYDIGPFLAKNSISPGVSRWKTSTLLIAPSVTS